MIDVDNMWYWYSNDCFAIGISIGADGAVYDRRDGAELYIYNTRGFVSGRSADRISIIEDIWWE